MHHCVRRVLSLDLEQKVPLLQYCLLLRLLPEVFELILCLLGLIWLPCATHIHKTNLLYLVFVSSVSMCTLNMNELRLWSDSILAPGAQTVFTGDIRCSPMTARYRAEENHVYVTIWHAPKVSNGALHVTGGQPWFPRFVNMSVHGQPSH